MPGQRKAVGPRVEAPGDGGERAAGALRPAGGRRGFFAKQRPAQRRHVAVEDHRAGGDPLPAHEPHRGGATALDLDPLDLRVKAKRRTLRFGQSAHRARQRMHAAFDRPDAFLLGMGDEHEGAGRGEGRGAAIGRVAAEELPQARIAEMAAERLPERHEGPGRPERAKVGVAHISRKTGRRGALRQHEALVQRRENAPRLGGEAEKALGLCLAGEAPDRVGRFVAVGEQVEALVGAGAAAVPGMAGEDVELRRPELCVEVSARLSEEFVEHAAQGEDGGASIDRPTGRSDLPHLAAGLTLLLDHENRHAARGEVEGGGETADAGADHDDRASHRW